MLRARQFPQPIHWIIPPWSTLAAPVGKPTLQQRALPGTHTLRCQPGFSRVHNGDPWVRVWSQGDGKWQGQRAGEGRGDERRWAVGSETLGAEPLLSHIIYFSGCSREPSGSAWGGAASHAGFQRCSFSKAPLQEVMQLMSPSLLKSCIRPGIGTSK